MGLEDIDPELAEELGDGEDNEKEVTEQEVVIPLHMEVEAVKKGDETIEEFASRMAARYQGILHGKQQRNVTVNVPDNIEGKVRGEPKTE